MEQWILERIFQSQMSEQDHAVSLHGPSTLGAHINQGKHRLCFVCYLQWTWSEHIFLWVCSYLPAASTLDNRMGKGSEGGGHCGPWQHHSELTWQQRAWFIQARCRMRQRQRLDWTPFTSWKWFFHSPSSSWKWGLRAFPGMSMGPFVHHCREFLIPFTLIYLAVLPLSCYM